MKLITTIILSLIFISPGKAQSGPSGPSGPIFLFAIAAGEAEIVIVGYGISTAVDNIKYLSDGEDQPSMVAGYIWGGLNMTAAIIINDQKSKRKEFRGAYIKTIGRVTQSRHSA